MPTGAELQVLLERYDRASNGLESEATARLQGIFDRSFRQLERELRTAYPELQSVGGLIAAQRKTLVLERLGGLLDLAKPGQNYQGLFEELLTLSNETGGSLAEQLIKAYEPQSQLPAFAGIPIEAIANVASESTTRLQRYSDEFKEKASVIVGQGLIQGWGAGKVATALRSELGVAKSKAETLARTEVMSALNQSAQSRYQQNGIELFQWFASPAERTCPTCFGRNGNVYEIGKALIPAHPNCRCITAPFRAEWQAAGLTDDAFAEQYRQEGLEQLAANGLKPNYGLAPFEKAARLEKPPKPAWRPGDPPLPVPEQPARARSQPQQSPPVLPQPRYLLPADHAISSLGDRYSADSLDGLLAQLGNPGASARVELFTEFVQAYEIQAIFDDPDLPDFNHFDTVQAELKNQSWANHPRELEKYTRAEDISAGYTHQDFSHIVVRVSSENQGPLILDAAASELLNGAAQNAIARLESGDPIFSFSSSAPKGSDTSMLLTYIHEMGHQVHYKAGMPQPPADVQIISKYAAYNEMEWFAEHFMLWMVDAETYRNFDPVGARFIEETLERSLAEDPQESLARDISSAVIDVDRMVELEDSYRALTPVEEAMRRSQAQQFAGFLKREEESLKRRTSGEIDRRLREYYSREADELRQRLNIKQDKTQSQIEIKSYDRELTKLPAKKLALENEAALGADSKAALEVVRQYEQIQEEINEAIAKLPPAGKTLQPGLYEAFYEKTGQIFDRLTSTVNGAKALNGRVGDGELQQAIARISQISKENLPGYQIQAASSQLEDKAAIRPC